MGLYIELGIFVLVLVFAIWQIHDVKKAQKAAKEKKAALTALNDATKVMLTPDSGHKK